MAGMFIMVSGARIVGVLITVLLVSALRWSGSFRRARASR